MSAGGGNGTIQRSPSAVSISAGPGVRRETLGSSSLSSVGSSNSSRRHMRSKKSRALNMRFSIAAVGNSAQPSLASFHSPRVSRLADEGGDNRVAMDDQLRALVVPYVRNLTSASYKSPKAANKPVPTVKGLAIEGRNLLVEEEARQLGGLIGTGSGSRPSSGEFSQGVASPAIQRVRKNGFFQLDHLQLQAYEPGSNESRGGGNDSNNKEVRDGAAVAARKFTGLAIRNEARCSRIAVANHGNTTSGDDGRQQQQQTHHIVKHHIFIPVVRELQ